MTRRKKKSRSLWVNLFALAALAGIFFYSSSGKSVTAKSDDATAAQFDTSELLEVVTPDSVPSQRISHTGFTLSFNPRMHIPNWVAWELTADETTGGADRKDSKFAPDPETTASADTYDYLYSGYDRGHMAPAADMKWSHEAMDDCFLLTNICPQAHELNAGAWNTLEQSARRWAKADSTLIIIAGPILNPAPHEFIGDNRVAVPKRFFKVILAPHANPIRALAFIMPNGYVSGGLQATQTTVDEVELATGLDFFAALPDSIESIVEAAPSDIHFWNAHAKSLGIK